MNEAPPKPAAAPLPRVRCLRAVGIGSLVSLVGLLAVVLADGAGYAQFLTLLLVLTTSPLLVLAWSSDRVQRQASEAARIAFRKHWTLVWLGAVVATLVTCVLLREWRGELAGVVRLAVLVLLGWTSLLVPVCWRLYRVLLNRKFWTRTAFSFACLATLVALAYGAENWRGRRAWERFRAEWETKGVKFTYAEVLSPHVPDEQNMAMHPLFKPALDYTASPQGWAVWRDTNGMQRLDSLTLYPHHLRQSAAKAKLSWPYPANSGVQNRTNGVVLANLADWQNFYRLDTNFATQPPTANPAADVLRYLKRHDENLALLDAALARPRNQFPIHITNSQPGWILLPHLANVKNITVLLALRATANLELGLPDDALRDVERAWRMCDAMEQEPFVMSQLVQIAIQSITLGSVAHGSARHQWEDRHLRRIEELLRPVNKFKSLENSLRSEAAGIADCSHKLRSDRAAAENLAVQLAKTTSLDGDSPVTKVHPEFGRQVMQFAPSGWFSQSLVHEEATLLRYLEPAFMDVERLRLSWHNQPRAPGQPWFYSCWPVRDLAGSFIKAAAKCARLQTNFDHARLAIALERHWLRHRAYSERLDALVPEFLDRLPHDLFDGQPMRYRREGPQGFVIWSIGFDGKDDNAGPLYFKGSGSVGEELGDLVWRYPQ